MRLVFVLVFGLSVAPNSESGGQTKTLNIGDSGTEFLEVCKNTENESDNKMIHAYTEGMCVGWVQGFMAGVYVSDEVRQTPVKQRMLRLPDEATTIPASRIVKKYIEEHPESAHMKTRVLAAVSLMDQMRAIRRIDAMPY